MTIRRDFKALVRARMAKTGESYTAACRSMRGPEPNSTNHTKTSANIEDRLDFLHRVLADFKMPEIETNAITRAWESMQDTLRQASHAISRFQTLQIDPRLIEAISTQHASMLQAITPTIDHMTMTFSNVPSLMIDRKVADDLARKYEEMMRTLDVVGDNASIALSRLSWPVAEMGASHRAMMKAVADASVRFTATIQETMAARIATPTFTANVADPAPTIKVWNSAIETSSEEARTIRTTALALEPRLCCQGIGLGDEVSKRRNAIRATGDVSTVENEFRDSRAHLKTEDCLEQIAAAADWIKRQRRISTYNAKHDSYGYKHLVERWFEHRRGYPIYVWNGCFIAAAIGLGFPAKPCQPPSHNPLFQFSERSIKETQTGCHPKA